MTNELSSTIWGGVSGAVLGGVFGYISGLALAKRSETRVDQKVLAARKDCIEFLRKLLEMQNDDKIRSNYLADLGEYRALRIRDALKQMKIMDLKSSSGGFVTVILSHYS
jgi:hypothetical protein